MPIVRTSSKFQVAIPKRIRAKLGIKPGQRLMVTDKEGAILLTPIPADPVEYLCGALQDEASLTDELLKERARDLGHE